jgi:hypothetical protein
LNILAKQCSILSIIKKSVQSIFGNPNLRMVYIRAQLWT